MASLHEAGKENSLVDRLFLRYGREGEYQAGWRKRRRLGKSPSIHHIEHRAEKYSGAEKRRENTLWALSSLVYMVDFGFGHTTIFHQK